MADVFLHDSNVELRQSDEGDCCGCQSGEEMSLEISRFAIVGGKSWRGVLARLTSLAGGFVQPCCTVIIDWDNQEANP